MRLPRHGRFTLLCQPLQAKLAHRLQHRTAWLVLADIGADQTPIGQALKPGQICSHSPQNDNLGVNQCCEREVANAIRELPSTLQQLIVRQVIAQSVICSQGRSVFPA